MKRKRMISAILKEKNFKMAILLNIFYLFFMLVFFEPFLLGDDYFMSRSVYGANTGYYDYATIYENVLYGKLLVFFLELMPNLPIYTLMFYLLVFVSLSVLTKKLLDWNNSTIGLIIVNAVLLFVSYEGYVAIQFTKIAGIVGAVGIMMVMLEKEHISNYVVGIVLFAMAYLIRSLVAQMLLIEWIIAAVGCVIVDCFANKGFDIKRYGKIFIKCMLLLGVMLCIKWSPKYESEQEKQLWINYWNYNSIRAGVQDASYLEIEQEILDDADVSENDILLWRAWNTDVDGLTVEKGEEILAGHSEKDTSLLDIDVIKTFFKVIPLNLIRIDVFLLLFMIINILVCSTGKIRLSQMIEIALIPIIMIFGVNYYLVYMGRYHQHRVDVGCIFLAIVFIVYILNKSEIKILDSKQVIRSMTVFFVCALLVRYGEWAEDKPSITSEEIEENRCFFDFTSQDQQNYYLMGNTRDNKNRQEAFGAFEVIPVGYYKNIIFHYDIYTKSILEKNGITDPYRTILDNDEMYLVLAENDNAEEMWEEYIGKRNSKNAHLVLVKKAYGKKVYRVLSEDIESIIEKIDNTDFEENLDIDFKATIDNSELTVNGVTDLTKAELLWNDLYVLVVDSDTNQKYVQYSSMSINKNICEITATMTLPDFYDESDAIYFIIKDGEETYCQQISAM